GMLRWQAPSSELTPEMDVYAYTVSCVEILSKGRLLWLLMSDEATENFMLDDHTRPKIPPTRFNTPRCRSCSTSQPRPH
ncbi:hypothetical protein FB451DRAFT_989333, partial [Mycena latifolia]